jgi:hypothetical protein
MFLVESLYTHTRDQVQLHISFIVVVVVVVVWEEVKIPSLIRQPNVSSRSS